MAKLQGHAEALIRDIVKRYQDEPTPLMMILEAIQNEYGYIPLEVQELLSELLNMSQDKVLVVIAEILNRMSEAERKQYLIRTYVHEL